MNATGRHGGHALFMTLATLVIMMLLWMVAFGQISSWLRTEKAHLYSQDRALGPTRAMAWGLKLLETGEPPVTPYACRANVGDAGEFVITFALTAPLQYQVAVRPATQQDEDLPAAPTEF